MKKPPLQSGGWIHADSALTLPSAAGALRLWHLASAAEHLIAAFPECPSWVSVAVDHITMERDFLLGQEVA